METENYIVDFIRNGHKYFLPHISIDCAIFGYHETQLKILLTCWKEIDGWCLPGGYIGRQESIHVAANRILKERTGLSDLFLQQYYIFGDIQRVMPMYDEELMKRSVYFEKAKGSWLDDRTMSIGYYAIVDFSKVMLTSDEFSRDCSWVDVQEVPRLMFDHNEMVEKALYTLRTHLNFQPIGINLLQDQFTLPEIQNLYETILGKKLDRRNFQKKILNMGVIKPIGAQRYIGYHRSPNLYMFDCEKYNQALAEGKGSFY